MEKNIKLTPDKIREMVYLWKDKIEVDLSEIHLRNMKRKWASISTNGRLTLNKELINLPNSLVEYVIVHELVHLLVPNHGKLYKAYMTSYLPDWQTREQQLNKFSNSSNLPNPWNL